MTMVAAVATEETRQEFFFMGRILGSYSGWDETDGGMILYDFIPTPELLAAGCPVGLVVVLWILGIIANSDEDSGKNLNEKDIVELIKGVPGMDINIRSSYYWGQPLSGVVSRG